MGFGKEVRTREKGRELEFVLAPNVGVEPDYFEEIERARRGVGVALRDLRFRKVEDGEIVGSYGRNLVLPGGALFLKYEEGKIGQDEDLLESWVGARVENGVYEGELEVDYDSEYFRALGVRDEADKLRILSRVAGKIREVNKRYEHGIELGGEKAGFRLMVKEEEEGKEWGGFLQEKVRELLQNEIGKIKKLKK